MDERGADPPGLPLAEHAAFVRAVARALAVDGHAAADLEQEAWLRAVRSPPRSNARGWFRTVLRSLAARAGRDAGRRGARERAAARPEGVPPGGGDSAAALREVTDAVLSLDPPLREVLLLRWYEDLPPRAVAERLGIPVNTVRGRHARALEALRARLLARRRETGGTWWLALLALGRDGAPPAGGGGTGGGAGGALLLGGALAKGTAAGVALLLLASAALWLARGDGDRLRESAGTGSGAQQRGGRHPASPASAGDSPVPVEGSGETGQPRRGTPAPAPAPHLVGEVLDAAGRPVPGGVVECVDPVGAPLPAANDLPEPRAEVAADGTFRLPLPTEDATIRARAPGFAPSPAILLADRRDRAAPLRIRLQRAGAVSGVVRDARGAAVAGCLVQMGRPWENPALHGGLLEDGTPVQPVPVEPRITDAAGRFRFEGVPAVDTELLCQAAGFAPDWRPLAVPPGSTLEVEIELPDGVALEGIVRDDAGAAVADAEVQVIGMRGVAGLRTRTDAEGRYRLQGLPPGRQEARVAAGERGRAGEVLRGAGGTTIRWDPVLSRGRELAGRVVGPGGEPLPRLHVEVVAIPLGFGGAGSAVTDGDGSFRIPSCDADRYELRVARAAGGLPLVLVPEVEPGGGDGILEVSAAALAGVPFRVALAEGGAPAAGLVHVAPVATRYAFLSMEADAATGVAGGALPPGLYRCIVRPGSGGVVDLGVHRVDAAPVDLGRVDLPARGILEVTFAGGGAGARDAAWRIDLVAADGERIPGETRQALPPALRLELRAGRYALRAWGNLLQGLEREFEIRPGESTALEVVVRPAPCRMFSWEPPPPPEGPRLCLFTVSGPEGGVAWESWFGRMDGTGRFLFAASLLDGEWEIRLAPDRGPPLRATVRVGPSDGLAVDAPIALEPRR